MRRILLIPPGWMVEPELSIALENAQEWAENRWPGEPVAVQSSRKHIEIWKDDAKEGRCDDFTWPDWISQVAEGIEYSTGRAYFDVLVVPHEMLGRATSEALQRALAAGKPVIYLNDQADFNVAEIEVVDSNNWKEYGRIQTTKAVPRASAYNIIPAAAGLILMGLVGCAGMPVVYSKQDVAKRHFETCYKAAVTDSGRAQCMAEAQAECEAVGLERHCTMDVLWDQYIDRHR